MECSRLLCMHFQCRSSVDIRTVNALEEMIAKQVEQATKGQNPHTRLCMGGIPFSTLKQNSTAALIPLTIINAAEASLLNPCLLTLEFDAVAVEER